MEDLPDGRWQAVLPTTKQASEKLYVFEEHSKAEFLRRLRLLRISYIISYIALAVIFLSSTYRFVVSLYTLPKLNYGMELWFSTLNFGLFFAVLLSSILRYMSQIWMENHSIAIIPCKSLVPPKLFFDILVQDRIRYIKYIEFTLLAAAFGIFFFAIHVSMVYNICQSPSEMHLTPTHVRGASIFCNDYLPAPVFVSIVCVICLTFVFWQRRRRAAQASRYAYSAP